MKRNLLVIIIVALLVLGGGLVYTKNKGSKYNTQEKAKNEEGVQSENENTSDSFVGSIKNAIEHNTPLVCTYKMDNGIEYKNYVKGRKLYGEVKTNDGNGQILILDNCMWSWSEGANQGIKICFDNEDPSQGSIWDSFEKQGPNAPYNCQPTTVNDNIFEVPSNVNFMSADNMGM